VVDVEGTMKERLKKNSLVVSRPQARIK